MVAGAWVYSWVDDEAVVQEPPSPPWWFEEPLWWSKFEPALLFDFVERQEESRAAWVAKECEKYAYARQPAPWKEGATEPEPCDDDAWPATVEELKATVVAEECAKPKELREIPELCN